jgi:polyferredoxin
MLGFLVYSVFFLMTDLAVKAFLDSPYNQVSDIKMYYFFANISQFSLIVISVLFLLSIVIRNFWCRYLCPYGALLGISSLLVLQRLKETRLAVSTADYAIKPVLL